MYIYSVGAIGYSFVEILWRGYTHWSMGVVGGLCMLLMYILEALLQHKHIVKKAIISAVIITVIEFISGIIINKIFKLNVWDYSNLKFNLMGQISLVYSIFWFLLCIPGLFLCKILKHRIFDVFKNNSLQGKIFER